MHEQSVKRQPPWKPVIGFRSGASLLMPLIAVALASVFTDIARAQQNLRTLPWESVGINREEFSGARRELEAARNNLPAPPEGQVWLPMWCSLAGSPLVMLARIDLQSGLLRALGHRILDPGTESAPFLRSNADARPKRSELPGATGRAVARTLSAIVPPVTEPPRSGSRLLVRISAGTADGRAPDQLGSLCLNMLLGASLVERGIDVVTSIGTENLVGLRTRQGITTPLRRPNRTVLATWTSPAAKISWPLSVQLTTRISDGVLGQPAQLDAAQELAGAKTWQFNRSAQGQVEFALETSLARELDLQQKSLLEEDLPRVARVTGAWAWVDRGRAWGLQMDDRLTATTETGETVAGHVVGFYGAEERLKSPRGFPITEGAIIFVRKGQALVQNGLNFEYDQTTYPVAPAH